MSHAVAFPREMERAWKQLGLAPWETRKVALPPLLREMENLGLEGNEHQMRMQLQAILAAALGTREGLDSMLLGQLLVAASLIRRKREHIFQKALDSVTQGDFVDEGTVYATTPEGSFGTLGWSLRTKDTGTESTPVLRGRDSGAHSLISSARAAAKAKSVGAGYNGNGNGAGGGHDVDDAATPLGGRMRNVALMSTPPTVPIRHGKRGLASHGQATHLRPEDTGDDDSDTLQGRESDISLDATQPVLGLQRARGEITPPRDGDLLEPLRKSSAEAAAEAAEAEVSGLHDECEDAQEDNDEDDVDVSMTNSNPPSPRFEEAEENDGRFQTVEVQLKAHDRLLQGLQAKHGELMEMLKKIEARQEDAERRGAEAAAPQRHRGPPPSLKHRLKVKGGTGFGGMLARDDVSNLSAESACLDVDDWTTLDGDDKPSLLSTLHSHYTSLLSKNATEQAETSARLRELELIISHMNTGVSADMALADVAKLMLTRLEVLKQRVEGGLAAAGRFETKYFAKYDFVVFLLILFAVMLAFR